MLYWSYIIMVIATIFAPNYGLLRPEYLLVAMLAVLGTAFGAASSVKPFQVEVAIVLMMVVSSSLSLFSQSLHGYEFSWRDAMIFVRILFTTLVIVAAAMAGVKLKNYTGFARVIAIVAWAVALITIMQYFNIFGLNERMFSHANARYIWLIEGVSWRRAVGTFGNPNYWGYLITVFLMFVTHSLVWRGKALYLPLAAALMYALILTGSRAALISYVLGMLLGGLTVALTGRSKPKGPWVVGVVIVLVIFLLLKQGGELYENEGRFSLENTATLEARIDVWKRSWGDSSHSILSLAFGMGERKAENIVHFGDNGYIRTLRDYGILGLALYLALLVRLVTRTIRLTRSSEGEKRWWAEGLLFVMIAWCIFELAADAWYFSRAVAVVLSLYVFIHSMKEGAVQAKPAQTASQEPVKNRKLAHRMRNNLGVGGA